METIESYSPVKIYTDGSGLGPDRVGYGAVTELPNGSWKTSKGHCGRYRSNYEAEGKAMVALILIRDRLKDHSYSPYSENHAVVFTDALSVLKALQDWKNAAKDSILGSVVRITGERSIVMVITLQWIPAHCGVPGNEEADRLAKAGASRCDPDQAAAGQRVTYVMARRMAQEYGCRRWLTEWEMAPMTRIVHQFLPGPDKADA